jgi:hypothetical protein
MPEAVDGAAAVDAQNAPTAASLKRPQQVNELFAMSSFALFALRPPSRAPAQPRARAGGRSHGESIHARYVTLLFALVVGNAIGSRRIMDIRYLPAAPSWTRLSRAAICGVALAGSRESLLEFLTRYAVRRRGRGFVRCVT